MLKRFYANCCFGGMMLGGSCSRRFLVVRRITFVTVFPVGYFRLLYLALKESNGNRKPFLGTNYFR